MQAIPALDMESVNPQTFKSQFKPATLLLDATQPALKFRDPGSAVTVMSGRRSYGPAAMDELHSLLTPLNKWSIDGRE